jgi:hypothetical protein
MTLLLNAPDINDVYTTKGESCIVTQNILETSWKVPFSVRAAHYGMFSVLLGRSLIDREPDSAWRLDDAVLTVRHTGVAGTNDSIVFATVGGVQLPATRLSEHAIDLPSPGDTLQLSVLANAMTSRVERTSAKHLRRAVPQELLNEWGSGLLATAGVHATECSIALDDPMFIEYGDNKSHGRRAIRVVPARVEATCVVVDTSLLARAFLLGIGSRRSYGFGQLVITQSAKGTQA